MGGRRRGGGRGGYAKLVLRIRYDDGFIGYLNDLADACMVANLDHPHIVPVLGVGSTDAFPSVHRWRAVKISKLSRRTS